MLEERTSLDMLSVDSVSIVKQKYYVEGVNEYKVGNEFRVALSNTEEGRNDLQVFIGEPYISTVLSLWNTKGVK